MAIQIIAPFSPGFEGPIDNRSSVAQARLALEYVDMVGDPLYEHDNIYGDYIIGNPVEGKKAYYHATYVIADLTGSNYALYDAGSVVIGTEIWSFGATISANNLSPGQEDPSPLVLNVVVITPSLPGTYKGQVIFIEDIGKQYVNAGTRASPDWKEVGSSSGSSAPVDTSKISGSVVHGTDPAVARPTGYPNVIWVGSVEPANAIAGDVWVNDGTDDHLTYFKGDAGPQGLQGPPGETGLQGPPGEQGIPGVSAQQIHLNALQSMVLYNVPTTVEGWLAFDSGGNVFVEDFSGSTYDDPSPSPYFKKTGALFIDEDGNQHTAVAGVPAGIFMLNEDGTYDVITEINGGTF